MEIQPDRWLPEYTTDLPNLLNVLGLLVDLEAEQAELLDRICDGPLITLVELQEAGALDLPPGLSDQALPRRGSVRHPTPVRVTEARRCSYCVCCYHWFLDGRQVTT